VDSLFARSHPNAAEVNMFARKVSVRLKVDSLQLFVGLMEGKVLPWLRKQRGFLDLITLALPDGSEVATLSFWDEERDAYAYDSTAYPEVLQILEEILDGIPYVKTFEVVGSTLHPLPDSQPQEAPNLTADNTQRGYQAYETSV
jgi:hypothetical protein